jgi:hypothetical protein
MEICCFHFCSISCLCYILPFAHEHLLNKFFEVKSLNRRTDEFTILVGIARLHSRELLPTSRDVGGASFRE